MPARESFRSYSPLLILGGLTVFAPLIDGGTTHLPVLIIRLILLVAGTVWIFVSMKSGRIGVPHGRLFLVIAIFVGLAVLSVVRSPYTAISLQWLLSILSYVLMLFLVLHLVDSLEQVRRLVVVILGMGLFEAAVGIYQFLWLGRPRAAGTFFNPNFFATYEVAVFAVVFGLLCYGHRAPAWRWQRLLLVCTAGVVALAFFLAQSRGAVLAFVAAVAFIGTYRFGKVFLVVLLLGLVAGVIVPNPVKQRILAVAAHDPYAYTRLDIWKNSFQRIADHPWGVGLGIYKYTSFQYRFPVENAIARYGKRAESAHNEYLQMGVELGIAGLAVFLLGIGLLGREIKEVLNFELESWERGAVSGLTGGVLGILAHGFVDSVFHEPALVLLFVLSGGMILAVKRLRRPECVSVRTVPFSYHPARAILVATCAVLLMLLIIRPAAAWYAFDKGEGELKSGREDRALEWLQRATRIDPGLTTYHNAVAEAEVRLFHQSGDLGWLRKAVEELGIGLELNPLDGRFAHRLGALYVILADRAAPGVQREALLQKAGDYFERATKLDPYSPFNYLELGRLRQVQGRMDESRSWFKRATSYEPNFLPARVRLAELSLTIGQKEIARGEYAEIVRIQARYRDRTLNALERQYLEVDLDPLKRSLAMADAS